MFPTVSDPVSALAWSITLKHGDQYNFVVKSARRAKKIEHKNGETKQGKKTGEGVCYLAGFGPDANQDFNFPRPKRRNQQTKISIISILI